MAIHQYRARRQFIHRPVAFTGLLPWGKTRIFAQSAVQRQVVQAADLRLIVFDRYPTVVWHRHRRHVEMTEDRYDRRLPAR